MEKNQTLKTIVYTKNYGLETYVRRYRFSFNGKENDNEVKGNGNQQDYGMRIYDNRLGRFLSEDPLTKNYPMLTPYQFASNTPTCGIDLDGLEFYYTADGFPIGKIGNNTQIRLVDDKDVNTVFIYITWANNSKKPKYVNYATDQSNKFSSPKPQEPQANIVKKAWNKLDKVMHTDKGELEGYDNPGNDRVAPGDPDAAGVSGNVDVPFIGGGQISKTETDNGTKTYRTVRTVLGGFKGGFVNVGGTLDMYYKTEAAGNTPSDQLIPKLTNVC